ncbi:hypothetical protein HMPREF3213_03097 [Heyndrickxia coagulans]|uniref:Uncharacterized protein n=1 Tax=Heyndrickxia coagulans TaxID=1398 RepID=A0A133KF12_HEYCO|nr:hypothetical protein HMPREF3213_03097 [Heyndrickxia coagulans]
MHSRIEYIHHPGRKILFARMNFFRINKKSMRLRTDFYRLKVRV